MQEDLEELLKSLIPPENFEAFMVEATKNILAKDQVRRFRVSMFILDQLLKEGKILIGEETDQQLKNWELCVNSVFELWEAASCLWRLGKFATATSLAISAIEETGKLAVERMRLLGIGSLTYTEEERLELSEEWSLRRKPFLDHLTKSAMASMSGALVNSRLDRIVGLDFVVEFLVQAEEGRLESLRQECLYLDRKDGSLLIPQNRVSKDESAKFVALAGEILVEILPHPADWENRLEQVKEFEKIAGLPYE